MRLQTLEITGFKSFSKKTSLEFQHPVVCIVGPNGSGKSNVVEAFRFVLGEQSMKSMRGKAGLDLIFKGSKHLPKGTKASATIYFNNEDKVFKLSNEGGEEIDLNYDVISISREVYTDGLNKYILNGTEVRLKDINNLLASVNIGSSGHHIISQGEADRVLNANQKDLREIIEDALGLKIYQYKIRETERKLERTNENMKEVSLLRRENAPHLNFLRKQVEKFEKAKEMQMELSLLYRVYLKNESVYLEQEKTTLSSEKNKISQELATINAKIAEVEESGEKENGNIEELKKLEKASSEMRALKGELDRKLGRIEGMIEMEERRRDEMPDSVMVSAEEVATIVLDINNSIDEAISKEDIGEIKSILTNIKNILGRFNKKENSQNSGASSEIENLKNTQKDILVQIEALGKKDDDLSQKIEALKQEINQEMEALRDKEREKFSFKVKQQELSSTLDLISVKENNLKREEEAFLNEVKEGTVLVGAEILSFKNFEVQNIPPRNVQEEERRKIERIKMKLEDAGIAGGGEIMKEYNEVSERDQFLAKEMTDLTESINSLQKLMAELKEKIDKEFKEGVKKINKEFQEFFRIMFDGGDASLSVVVDS
ncbi:AAA family ATPase [Candidatus Nomurabacteria bacterium]|nr:AAA family ATPase [Candidatus Nomurabacteria bacterium]